MCGGTGSMEYGHGGCMYRQVLPIGGYHLALHYECCLLEATTALCIILVLPIAGYQRASTGAIGQPALD